MEGASGRDRRLHRRSDRDGRRRAHDADPRPRLRGRPRYGGVERPACVARDEADRRDGALPSWDRELVTRPLARRSARSRPRSRACSCSTTLGSGDDVANEIKNLLGWALIVAAVSMVASAFLSAAPAPGRGRSRSMPSPDDEPIVREARRDGVDRPGGRVHRRHDVRRVGLADDGDAAAAVPASVGEAARRHRSGPGDPTGRMRRRSATCCSVMSTSASPARC